MKDYFCKVKSINHLSVVPVCVVNCNYHNPSVGTGLSDKQDPGDKKRLPEQQYIYVMSIVKLLLVSCVIELLIFNLVSPLVLTLAS